MRLHIPEICWHEREPIYSCCFHPFDSTRFVTAGITNRIRIWKASCERSESIKVQFLSEINCHSNPVNIVRFNHAGTLLASGGDDNVIFLSKLSETQSSTSVEYEYPLSENWGLHKTLRGHLESVLDLAWSKDDQVIVSGAVDSTVIVWHLEKGTKIAVLQESKGYVQGVCIDPLDQYYCTLSADRRLRIYSAVNCKCIHNVSKIPPFKRTDVKKCSRHVKMFHPSTVRSFYRRLGFTPDGTFLIATAGFIDEPPESSFMNAAVFHRSCLSKPIAFLPTKTELTVAVCSCPLLFKLKDCRTDGLSSKYELPYRMVFALLTENSVLFYDTQRASPFGYVTDIHYVSLTDIAWSADGKCVGVSSIDGYITFIIFEPDELGEIYEPVSSLIKVKDPAIKPDIDESTKIGSIVPKTKGDEPPSGLPSIIGLNEPNHEGPSDLCLRIEDSCQSLPNFSNAIQEDDSEIKTDSLPPIRKIPLTQVD